MRKRLSAVGNSLGIIIEKPILELLHIDKDTELEVSTDGERLILEPVRTPGHRRRVAAATRRAMEAHRELLEKLAPVKEPEFLEVDDVLAIHDEALAAFGGSAGVRDPGLLASAVAMPRASFGGDLLHEDLFAMAAAYAFHLAQNQPFVDGNKRTAILAAIVFLDLNGVVITEATDPLHDAMMAIAERRLDKQGLAETLRRLGARP